MELKYYLDIFFRRRRLFLLVALALALLPLLLTVFREPVYQATARAILLKRDMKLLLSASLPDEFSAYNYFDADFVQDNLMEIIKSPATLRRVADKFELEGDPKEIYSSLPYLQALFQGTRPLVKAENISDTDIFEFQAYASTLDKAQQLAEAYYTAFGELWNQMHQDVIARMESGVIARQVELSRELAEVSDKERHLKKQTGVGDFVQAIQKEYEQLSAQKTTLNNVVVSNQLLDTHQRELKKHIKKVPQFRVINESFEINPVVSEAKSKLANLLWTLGSLRTTVTDEHVDIKSTLAQVEAAKQTIMAEALKTFQSETKELYPYYEELLKRYYDNEINRFVDGHKEKALAAHIAKLQSELVALSSQMLNLSPVSKENETILTALANNVKALDAIKLLKKVDVSHMLQINRAGKDFESGKPYFPRRTLLVLFSLFSGMTLAFIAVLLAEYLDPSLKSRLELEQITGRPVFHSLAHQPLQAGSGPGRAASPAEGDMATLAQALVLARRQGPLVAGVVSVDDGEGKTTVALGLARLLSQEGGRVLLLDMDPASGQYAVPAGGAAGAAGPQASGGAASLHDRVRTVSAGLDLLPLGQLPRLEVARLYPRLLDFLERVRGEAAYEFVLLDLPALSQGASSLTYLAPAELVLFVVGLGAADAYQTSKCFHQLAREAEDRPMLLVANQERQARRCRDWVTGLLPRKWTKSA